MASFWQKCVHKYPQKAGQEGKMLVLGDSGGVRGVRARFEYKNI
jgi:hypothetical protein